MPYPTAVVTNTEFGGTVDAGPDGVPFTPDTARAYAGQLNAACKPEYQTWQAFALVPLDGTMIPDGCALVPADQAEYALRHGYGR